MGPAGLHRAALVLRMTRSQAVAAHRGLRRVPLRATAQGTLDLARLSIAAAWRPPLGREARPRGIPTFWCSLVTLSSQIVRKPCAFLGYPPPGGGWGAGCSHAGATRRPRASQRPGCLPGFGWDWQIRGAWYLGITRWRPRVRLGCEPRDGRRPVAVAWRARLARRSQRSRARITDQAASRTPAGSTCRSTTAPTGRQPRRGSGQRRQPNGLSAFYRRHCAPAELLTRRARRAAAPIGTGSAGAANAASAVAAITATQSQCRGHIDAGWSR